LASQTEYRGPEKEAMQHQQKQAEIKMFSVHV